MMQSGTVPATVWLLVVMGVLVSALDGAKAGARKQLGEKLAAAVIDANMLAIERAYEEVQVG